ncbi:MAG: transporter [Bacteroidales bacterium]
MQKSTLSLLWFLLGWSTLFAQSDSLPTFSPDRPTQSISPVLVGKTFFQIETGAMYTNREDDVSERRSLSIGTTLLRYGVLSNLELRLESGFESTQLDSVNTPFDTAYSGLGAVSAGFKVFICEEKGIRPALAIVGSITFRHLGNENFAPTYSYPIGKLAASHALSKQWSLGYNIGFAYNGETPDGFFVYSIFTGYKISEHLWSFAEVYGKFDHGDFPRHRLDGGFTYLLRKNLQIDLTGGYGLNKEVKRFFINGGVSWRIPK